MDEIRCGISKKGRHACGPGTLTIQFTPNRSVHIPNSGVQNVAASGIVTESLRPPSRSGSVCLQNKDVTPVLARQMHHRLIERGQHQPLPHRNAKQVGVRNLVVSMHTLGERLG